MKFQVYSLKKNGNIIWNISSDIEVDKAYWFHKRIYNISVIDDQFSIAHALALVDFFQKNTSSVSSYLTTNRLVLKEKPTTSGFNVILSGYQLWKVSSYSQLEGRLLLLDELTQLILKVPNLCNNDIELNRLIQIGYLLEDIKIDSSVSYPYSIKRMKILKDNICNRCGSSMDIIIQSCSLCEDYCATCENCIIQGRSKSCIPLLYFQQNFSKTSPHKIIPIVSNKSIKYSQAQLFIANKLVEFIEDKQSKDFLVWAVTGAGKTEMTFPAIRVALEKGKKVLFTAPRKDVIRDLTIRFKDAFPEVTVISLYNESKEKWMEGNLYLATVQQTIRFFKYFDLVIIDELDAYPFQNDKDLQYFVKRSLKVEAKTIFMTATPPKEWLESLKKQSIAYLVLSARYHGEPLPVPIIKFIPKSEQLLKRDNPFSIFSKFINEVKDREGNGLIFVPWVKDVSAWADKLQEWFNGESIAGIHANDQKRNEKISLFKTNKIRFLVTTTILERGVTFSNLHVLVINAEKNVFDEATLVQIAGRVGRSVEHPSGLVWFLAEYMTRDIAGCIKQINRMNKHAKSNKDINEKHLF